MKNRIKVKILVTGLLVLILLGCDPEIKYIEKEVEVEVEKEVEKEVIVPDPTLIFRETVINLDFNGTARAARVEGTLLLTEWNGAADKVKNAIEAAYGKAVGDPERVRFTNVFNRPGFTIILTKENYPTYKANNASVLYLNVNKLNDAELSDKIKEAIIKMGTPGGYGYPAIGKAVPIKNKYYIYNT